MREQQNNLNAGKQPRTSNVKSLEIYLLSKETPQREHLSFLSKLKLSVYKSQVPSNNMSSDDLQQTN